jgi:hypothetical protein
MKAGCMIFAACHTLELTALNGLVPAVLATMQRGEPATGWRLDGSRSELLSFTGSGILGQVALQTVDPSRAYGRRLQLVRAART